MNDYTWPSVYFAYLFFAICLAVAVYFFIRSRKDGYWSKEGEDIKYRVFDDDGAGPGGPPADGEAKSTTEAGETACPTTR